MIASLNWGNNPFQTHAIATSGSEQVASILQGMVDATTFQREPLGVPLPLLFRESIPRQWEREKIELYRKGAFKKEELSRSSLQMTVGDRLMTFSDGITQRGGEGEGEF